MAWSFLTQLAVAFVINVVSFLLTRKPAAMNPAAAEQLEIPAVHQGDSIIKLFGSKKIKSAAVPWYGDIRTSAIKKSGGRKYGIAGPKKKVTVGHRYYGGIQFVLGLSHFDHIYGIEIGDKEAWVGKAEVIDTTDYTVIAINQPGLFGGEDEEGGIAGTLDVGFGYKDQGRNDYLADQFGDDCPAYRGVMTAIWRQGYLGTSKYIKPWAFWAQRIHRTEDGELQWHNEKAAIGAEALDAVAIYIAMDISGSMGTVTSNGQTRLENMIAAVKAALDYVLLEVQRTLATVDIMLVGWGTQPTTRMSIMRRGVDSADIDALKSWLDGVEAGYPYSYWTYFPAGLMDAPGFFDGASADARRKIIFITDGGPTTSNGSQTQTEIAEDAQAIVQSIEGVESHAFNIDLEDTTYTAYVDNTASDGVPVIDGADASAIEAVIRLSIYISFDMNPIHIVRELMTDQDAGGQLAQSEFGPTWETVADQAFAEGAGMSLIWTEEESVDAMVAEVVRHIDCVRYEHPDTGDLEIGLIRGGYDVETLAVLDPSNSDVLEWRQTAPTELFNQVTVKFWNRETGEEDSLKVQDTAAITQLGKVKNRTQEYLGFTRASCALQVGLRDLAQMSRPWGRGKVRTTRATADLMPGDVFKLTDPDNGLQEVVCRVAKRTEGGLLDGHITLEVTEDVFGVDFSTYTVPTESKWQDPVGDPRNLSTAVAFEVPYLMALRDAGQAALEDLATNTGFFGYAGERPTGGVHLNYRLYAALQGEPAEDNDTEEFTPVAEIAEEIDDLSETTLPISRLIDADLIDAGTLAFIGTGGPRTDEWVLIVDAPADDADSLNVLRSIGDSVPKAIPAGAVVYVVEAAAGVALDAFGAGDTAEGYGAPINGNGEFEGLFLTREVEFDNRIDRPYPPGNLTIDAQSYPGGWYSPSSQQVNFAWSYRGRVVQSDLAVSHFDATDYGPEAGTTYRVEADAYDVDDELLEENWLSTNVGTVKTYTLDLDVTVPPASTTRIDVRIWAVRDSLDSWQAASVSFLYQQTLLGDQYTALPVLDIDGNYLAENS